MFASVVKPACGVPPAFYVNSAFGSELTAVCTDVRSITVVALCVTLAVLIVLQSRFVTRAVRPSAPNSASAHTTGTAAAAAGTEQDEDARSAFPHHDTGSDANADTDGDGDAHADGDGDAAYSSFAVRGHVTRPATTRSGIGRLRAPVLSATWAIVPLVLALVYVVFARAVAESDYQVARETFAASQLPKTDFIQLEAMDRRARNSSRAALTGSSVVTLGSFVPKSIFFA